jgi:hypothetical protein
MSLDAATNPQKKNTDTKVYSAADVLLFMLSDAKKSRVFGTSGFLKIFNTIEVVGYCSSS